MNETRQAVKVGLFVVLGLVMVALLAVKFSKNGAFFTPAYSIRLVTGNVAGIKTGAAVLMAGVPVGNVTSADLAEDGRTVIIHLRILERYRQRIRRDARFLVEQAGFLGDQYVSIVPRQNTGPVIAEGETIQGEEAFNFQEIARSAAGLMQRADQAVAKLNVAVDRIDQSLLSEGTLTNISLAVDNFRNLSARALVAMDSVERLLRTNAPAVGTSMSNLVSFSHELKDLSGQLRLIIETNRVPLISSISNAEIATIQVNRILTGLEEGRGLAGSMLKDDQLRLSVTSLSSNLAVASSNLNQKGLWRFLWKPKQE
jgi:ABC-type transporter Mla subunit MlaD